MPKWRMTTATHEIVAPTGGVTARLRIGKNYQLAVDDPADDKIRYGSGSAFGYHVSYNIATARRASGSEIFPADVIGCELHYFIGKDYAGHTIRPIA
jgi:hypothetical protein